MSGLSVGASFANEEVDIAVRTQANAREDAERTKPNTRREEMRTAVIGLYAFLVSSAGLQLPTVIVTPIA